jgi:NADPH:quinone reductase-like Zn-dependent oxidoreductase
MRAVRIHAFGGLEVIKIEQVPTPSPTSGEVRVRVQATSVNPVDYKIREGQFLPEDKLPLTLGRDMAGIVDECGADTSGALPIGTHVFAMMPMDQGANAEFVTLRPELCALSPTNIDVTAAASLGLAALTAWQGLFDQGGVVKDQRVLIHGAAGGVGHLAVQFAIAIGATVFATCSKEDVTFVRELGAADVIDYKVQRFEEHAQDIDMVFDLIGGETQDRSWSVIRPGGILVSTLSEPDPAKHNADHVRGAHYMAQPNGAQLAEVARLIENGLVKPFVDRVLPLDQAAEAHRALEHDHIRGKIVLTIA